MSRTNEVAWNELEEDQKNLQPTPPVGKPIVWYHNGDKNHPVAAQVTGIDGPGRIKAVVFPINAFPQHKAGVYHVSAKIHTKPNNPTTRNCGSWDYFRGDQVHESDYELHLEELSKREANLRAGEEAAQKNAELFAEKQAERASGKKKRLPDPLPAPA